MMIDKLNRAGGILPLTDITTLYSNAVVEYAEAKKLITIIIINRRDANNAQPDRQIKAAHTATWSGTKPDWLR